MAPPGVKRSSIWLSKVNKWIEDPLTTVDWASIQRKTEILLEMTVKIFIGYILLELDLKDSKALARQKKPSALVDNNFSRRLKLNFGT